MSGTCLMVGYGFKLVTKSMSAVKTTALFWERGAASVGCLQLRLLRSEICRLFYHEDPASSLSRNEQKACNLVCCFQTS